MREESILDELQPQMVEWRRFLHRHPELSYHEQKTSQFVAEQLQAMGIEVTTRVGGGYGVLGILKGSKPGRTVALRADMDALPIQDEKKCEYSSEVPGVMHACGHDGHTSILLAVATYFSARRQEIEGEIRFIFQPAEEIAPGGAQGMIAAGVLDQVDVIYGLHLWTPFPVGTAASAGGPLMAAADEFFVDIIGKGGHGGIPHVTVDSIVVGSALVMQLQTIVNRSVDPLQPAVVTVGTFQGGTAQNVIAESTRITGTVRTFDDETRHLIRNRLETLTNLTAQAYGAEAELKYVMGYPPVVNDEGEAERFFQEAPKVFGSENVTACPKLMPAEDFAFYLKEIPGCFMFVGAGNEAIDAVYPHHHAKFNFDESAMLYAAKLLVTMTQSYQGWD
ncbi:amidohydrolase [Paenibacillus pini]|uniref:Catalyzes the cleavage of p-aminobenzoyl-glutamate to p-aminobenzoate and glutamate n=1 Tax=Paenibacillus pini JCM 16418 TaxID=1236976 RepID=W7YHW3_9BACL|nr:amidohydrolase [Paenibacillus pini]GAF07173.1 catalyzes the cleavage of p-aminobenzoyl-glutamate to p-aminobenzoate and glutamate [Paenibacillus pini JCM 16418]